MYTLIKCIWVHAHLHVLTCTNIHAFYTEHCFSHSFTQAPGNKWNVAVVGLMEAQTAIHIYRKHSSSQSRDKPLPTSPCKSRNHSVLPVTSRAVRSWTCSMRAVTYMREHTALSTPSQASQQMCQGWSPLLGYFCKQQGAFQCCCQCKVAGEVGGGAGAGAEQRLFVNICDLASP